MNPSYKSSRWSLIVAFLCLFWIAFPFVSPPISNDADDIMFVGPALELAQGKPMSSHHERDRAIAANINPDQWFLLPPLYQQILGSWLSLFGVSRKGFILFQIAVNLGITAALMGILHRFGVALSWGIPPLLMLSIAEIRDWGMRPEAAGMLLLLWGVFFLLRRNTVGAFAAGACLIGAGLVLQQAGIYAGLFLLVSLISSCAQGLPSKQEETGQWWRHPLTMTGGATIPTLVFLQGIHWNVPEFLRQYSFILKTSGGLASTKMNILSGYWSAATVGWEWANLSIAAALFIVVIGGFLRMRNSFERCLLGAMLAGLLVNVLVVHVGSYRLTFMYVLIACAAFCLLGRCTRFTTGRVVLGMLSPVVALTLATPALGAYFHRLPSNAKEVKKVVLAQNCPMVYLDAYAAGAVFDWRLPENAQSLRDCKGYSLQNIFGRTWPPIPPHPGELYIIEKSDYQEIPLKIMGRTLHSANLNRWQWDVVDFRGRSLLTGEVVGFP